MRQYADPRYNAMHPDCDGPHGMFWFAWSMFNNRVYIRSALEAAEYFDHYLFLHGRLVEDDVSKPLVRSTMGVLS